METERQMPTYPELVALLGWEPNPTDVQKAVDRGFTNPYMFKRPNETFEQRFYRRTKMMDWNGKTTWVWAN